MQPQKAVALGPILKKLVPVCFVTGAAMELFMVKTGFYEIVTKNEAERRQLRDEERQEYLREAVEVARGTSGRE